MPLVIQGTILLKIFQVPEKFLCDSEMAGYRAVELQSVLLVWCVATFARAQSKFCHCHFFSSIFRICRRTIVRN